MPMIVIEGIDSSGKTTLARALADRLQELGKEVRLFREPGGTPESQAIREVLGLVQNPFSRFFLFLASRAELCAQIQELQAANPKLWIILDRFSPSTFAYQTFLDPVQVRTADRIARQGVNPNLVFWLDLPIDQALERLREKESDLPMFESAEVLEKAASVYQKLYDEDQATAQIWRHLDAQRPLGELVEQAVNRLVVLFATGRLSPHA